MSTQYLQESEVQSTEALHQASRTTLLENDEVLVIATTYPPGGTVPTHAHRYPSVVCVVEGGTLETTSPDGTIEKYDVRPGEALWSGAAHVHSARNIGPTPVRIVEIEVKHAAVAARGHRMAQRVLTPADLEWRTDPFDPRRTSALLAGDPAQPGPYAVRLRAPAGYEIGLHMHPDDDEQLTVLSGAVLWSTGEAGSGAGEYTLGPGGFAFTPAGTPHRLRALEDTLLQMSGTGPRTYIYVGGGALRGGM